MSYRKSSVKIIKSTELIICEKWWYSNEKNQIAGETNTIGDYGCKEMEKIVLK